MGGFGGGPTKKPQGGQAWTFYSSLKIMLKVIGKDRGKEWDGLQNKMIDTVKGNVVKAILDKCKVSDAYKHEATFYLMNGIGVDNERTVLDLAISTNIIKKGGAWYTWVDPTNSQEYKGQGLAGFKNLLPDNWLDIMFNQVKPSLANKTIEKEEPILNKSATDALNEFEDLFGT